MGRKKLSKNKKSKNISKGRKKVAMKKTSTKTNYKTSAFKANEEKIKIKKILKQPVEKKIYNLNDYVVFPKHGVGKILAVEKAKIGDIDITFYKVFIEKEKLTLSIPINQ